MSFKRVKFIVEMSVPDHFVIATTRHYVEEKLKAIYPDRDIRVTEFNRIAAIEERRERQNAPTGSPHQVLRQIKRILDGASEPGAAPRHPSDRPKYSPERRAEIIRTGVALNVPYADKDLAHQLGAIFDGARNIWVAPAEGDLTPFRKRRWLPD